MCAEIAHYGTHESLVVANHRQADGLQRQFITSVKFEFVSNLKAAKALGRVDGFRKVASGGIPKSVFL